VTVRIDSSLGQTLRINPSLGQTLLYAGGSAAVLKDWPIGGPTPTSLVDKSGNRNDLTFDSVTPVQLDSGLWVYETDGTNGGMKRANTDVNNLTGLTQLGLKVWVYIDNGGGRIIDFVTSYSSGGFSLYTLASPNRIVFGLATSGGGSFPGVSGVSTGIWYCVQAWFDGTNQEILVTDLSGNTFSKSATPSNVIVTDDAVPRHLYISCDGYDSVVLDGKVGLPRISPNAPSESYRQKTYAMEKSLFE